MSVQVILTGPGEAVTVYDSLIDGYDLALSELSCVVEVNAAGSAKLGFPSTHLYRADLESLVVPYRTVVEIIKDGAILFRGRALPPSVNLYKTLSLTCEGELGFLYDSSVAPGTYSGTPEAVLLMLITAHNAQTDVFKRFGVGTVTIDAETVELELDEPCTTLAAVKQILEKYGGSLSFSTVADSRVISWTDSAGQNEQKIQLGVNLIDILKSYSTAELVNRVIPYGKKIDGVRVTIASPGYVEDAASQARYGAIAKAVTFSGIEDPSELQQEALKYLDEHKELVSSFTLRAVDLSNTANQYDEYIVDVTSWEVGKTVAVISAPHSIDGRWLLSRREYDLLDPTRDKLTLGALPVTLTGTYV